MRLNVTGSRTQQGSPKESLNHLAGIMPKLKDTAMRPVFSPTNLRVTPKNEQSNYSARHL